jgi:hypothetical protein
MARKKAVRKLATLDYETDPFKYGRIPKPFVAGFYSDDVGFKYFWGSRCVEDLLQFLDDLEHPHTIYAHNGGKFDFFLMLEHLQNPLKIINGRIVKSDYGIHTFKDSYAILPVPLSAYQKDSIDYRKMEATCREEHQAEIISYLETDCRALFSLVRIFLDRFGDNLTIGGTAIKELRKIHPFEIQRNSHDEKYRPYYFGGRVEFFESGVLRGNWKVYDVNSMYPYVMSEMDHPTGSQYLHAYSGVVDKKGRISGFANAKFYFARIECQQLGAFPIREKNAPLNFNCPEGEFFVTSHELKAAMEAGRVQNIKVKEVRVPLQTIRFPDYVAKFMAEKIAAKKAGNKGDEIIAKLMLNSAYGKFGQNPEHYFDYMICHDEAPENDDYEIYYAAPGKPTIWRKPANSYAFYDVATAASITGAARSVLLRALSSAKRAVYCDTDSIICESLDLPLDDSALGKWKLEASGNVIAVAGKKIYALKDGKKFVKTASKGAILAGEEIFELCMGKVIHWKNEAPSFSLANGVSFVDRKIRYRAG